MARYPAARWRPIPATWTQPAIRPTAAIAHSAGGQGDLYGWWLNPAAGGLESHFWVSYAGAVSQYVDTEVRADANGEANGFAISIETESTVHATERWPPAQAVALILLLVWLVQTHGIPSRIMTHPTDRGLAWHIQFGAPGPWTRARGKVCPGPARIAQYQAEIVPEVARRVAAGLPSVTPTPIPSLPPIEEDWLTMATEQDLRRIISEELDARGLRRAGDGHSASTGTRVTESLGRVESLLGDDKGGYGRRLIAWATRVEGRLSR